MQVFFKGTIPVCDSINLLSPRTKSIHSNIILILVELNWERKNFKIHKLKLKFKKNEKNMQKHLNTRVYIKKVVFFL